MIDFCPTYVPSRGGVCSLCGRNFEEHCAQFGIKVKGTPNVEHKPWCHVIVKLGDHQCNCQQPSAQLVTRVCEKWRETVGGNCICGLPWLTHTLKARNGWLTKASFKPGLHADDVLMTNEEAAEWITSLGATQQDRINKIQELLINAVKDKMSDIDKIFLEQALKVLQHSEIPASEMTGRSKHPCPKCQLKRSDQAGKQCFVCDDHDDEEASIADAKKTALASIPPMEDKFD